MADFTPEEMHEFFQSLDTFDVGQIHRAYRWTMREIKDAMAARYALGDPTDSSSVGAAAYLYDSLEAKLIVAQAATAADAGLKMPAKHLLEAMARVQFADEYKAKLLTAELKLALNQKLGALDQVKELLRSMNVDSRGTRVQ